MPVCKRMKNLQLDDSQDMDDEDSPDDEDYNMANMQSISRAEKSKQAAKMRRDKEGVEMERLSKLLPYTEEVIAKLDKGSVIRLAIHYLRMKHYVQKDIERDTSTDLVPVSKKKAKKSRTVDTNFAKEEKISLLDEGKFMLEALNGFLIFISKKQKKIQFVSESGGILGPLTGNTVYINVMVSRHHGNVTRQRR
ncbi:hypothetical protein ScPMuIL_014123 [Solemya velum]